MRKQIDLWLAEIHVSVLLYHVLAACVYIFQFSCCICSVKCTAEVSLTIHGSQRYNLLCNKMKFWLKKTENRLSLTMKAGEQRHYNVG